MNLKMVKQWRDTAEVMGEIRHSDEVNWLIRRVEVLEDAMKPMYVEPAADGRDLVMTEPVRECVFRLREIVKTATKRGDDAHAALDATLDRAEAAEREVARLKSEIVDNSGIPTDSMSAEELAILSDIAAYWLDHSKRCDNVANRTMADKQKRRDLSRVEVLEKAQRICLGSD